MLCPDNSFEPILARRPSTELAHHGSILDRCGPETKAEIISLQKGRREESLENIRQFILDLDELDYIEFLYPSAPDFAEDLNEHAAEAEGMHENLRDIEETLRDLGRGKIRIQ